MKMARKAFGGLEREEDPRELFAWFLVKRVEKVLSLAVGLKVFREMAVDKKYRVFGIALRAP